MHLRSLTVSGNPLTDEGVAQLASALSEARHMYCLSQDCCSVGFMRYAFRLFDVVPRELQG